MPTLFFLRRRAHPRIGRWAYFLVKPAQPTEGFTLIELLVTMAILVVLAAIMFSSLSSFRQSAAFDQAIDDTLNLLREARTKSLGSQDDKGYGVHFDANRVVMFQNFLVSGSYDDADPANVTFNFPSGVDISVIDFGGTTTTNNVYFERLTGETKAYATITFRSQRFFATKQIRIFSSGAFVKL